jgi:hypothetical protein
MAKAITYMEVHNKINELVAAHKITSKGMEYSATLGTLSALMGMMIEDSMKPKDVMESLDAAIERAKA